MKRTALHRWLAIASLAWASLAAAGPADGTWRALAPPPRQAIGRVALDAVHGRLLLFGGAPSYRSDVYELPLSGARVWKRLAVQGTPPSARGAMSIIDDPIRDRLIVFGGTIPGGTPVGEVWELSLAGTPTWSQLNPAGGGPGPLSDHSAIYDPIRDRMVVFGGVPPARSDVWALSLAGDPVWQQLAPTGTITARYDHTAVYDPVGDRMIVFGGFSGATWLGDVKALSLGDSPAWTTLTPAAGPAPTARYAHAAAWDPVRQQMLIFGGASSVRLSDAWKLSFAPSIAWASLPGMATGATPYTVAGHFAAYDPVQDGVIVGDGLDQFGYEAVEIELPLASPTAWVSQSFAPSGGNAPAFALDAAHGRAVLFEGFGTWQASLGDEPVWTPILLSGAKPPLRRSALHDPVRNRMLIVAESAVWTLDLSNPTAWTTLVTTGSPPAWSGGQAVTYDPVRDRMLVWDGTAAHGIWQLSLSGTPAWSPLAVAGSPPADRSSPALVYEPAHDRLVAFGGFSANDAWEIPLASSPTWSPIAATGLAPPSLGSGSCVLDALRHRLVVFGTGNGAFRALSLEGTPNWTALSPQGSDRPFPSTTYIGAVFDASHDRIVTYGGLDGMDQPQAFAWDFSGILDAPRPAPVSGRLAFSLVAPDPASGEQRFEWTRPAGRGARLSIYDVTGHRVWSHVLAAGEMRATWTGAGSNGRSVPPGVYFAQLAIGDDVARRRIVRLW